MAEKKIKFSQGLLIYSRKEVHSEFTCDRCNSPKKSKIIVKWIDKDNKEKTICNGCYGYLLGM